MLREHRRLIRRTHFFLDILCIVFAWGFCYVFLAWCGYPLGRPGITCIWQVTGRNKIADFNQWAKLDLDYIDKWSLLLDLKILLKTIPAVVKGTGL